MWMMALLRLVGKALPGDCGDLHWHGGGSDVLQGLVALAGSLPLIFRGQT